MKIDSFGEKSPLKDGPRNMERTGSKSGKIETFGEESPLSRSVTPMDSFDKGISGGKIQSFGEEVPLNRTEHRGWESHETPMSKNTRPDRG